MPDGCKTQMVGLSGIAIPPDRLRKLRQEVVDELAASIRVHGLLHPILIRPRSRNGIGFMLVAGRHRLAAVKQLKHEAIRAEVREGMEADAAELAEIDENLIRADLSPAERAAHQARRKELYEKRHPETKVGGDRRSKRARSKSQVATLKQTFIEDVADKTGKHRATIAREVARGQKVVVLSEVAGTSLDQGAELDALAKLPEDEQRKFAERAMAGEKVSAKTRVKQIQRDEREAKLGQKQLALPDRVFGVIVADPEWDDTVWSRETGMDRHAANHYPTSNANVIASRSVASIAAKDAVLFLWTTNQHLRIAIGVLETWGFEYKSNYVWGKDKISTGRWNRSKHEILLIGTCGKPPCPAPGTQWDSLIMAPTGEHSAKPECFLEMIESYYPAMPKIELNRRGPARVGWEAWGNEVAEAAE